MKFETVQPCVALACALLTIAGSSGAQAATGAPVIGVAVTKGNVLVNQATVAGNATLFDGATVETHQFSSSLDLASGPSLLLGPDSKGQVFSDRLILEKGLAEMKRSGQFRIEAPGLRIRSATDSAVALVALVKNRGIQIAATTGGVQVLNANGLLVAAIEPGEALEFDPQTAGKSEVFSGCLRSDAGHFLITDAVTNVVVEVTGPGLGKESGNRVEVSGAMDPATTPVRGATQVVRLTAVKRLGKGCIANKAAAAGTGGAAGGGGTGGQAGAAAGTKIAGMTVTTIAIIGGVAGAAVIGGLAASGTLATQSR